MSRVFSFGGGVQSTAALVLAARGDIDFKDFLFANVGDESEHPETMRYLREVAMPYASAHGLTIHELHRVKKDGSIETLWGRMTREGGRSLPIPVYFKPGGMPGGRACTQHFKIQVVQRWIKAAGATPETPFAMGIGISTDEWHRAKPAKEPFQVNEYPLIDKMLTRQDCKKLIREAGLPVPPRSACFYCPFHSIATWRELYDNSPDLFQRAVDLEVRLNEGREERGKDPVYLTNKGLPLNKVVTGEHQGQLSMLVEEPDGGYSCGPFTCDGTGGGSFDPSDPFAGMITKGGPVTPRKSA